MKPIDINKPYRVLRSRRGTSASVVPFSYVTEEEALAYIKAKAVKFPDCEYAVAYVTAAVSVEPVYNTTITRPGDAA